MFFFYHSSNIKNKNDNWDPDLMSDQHADRESNSIVNKSIPGFYLVFFIIITSVVMATILNSYFKKWNLFGWYKN